MTEKKQTAGRPRSEQSRLAILTAVMEIAHTEGYAGLNIERIAREAGVGKPTIYRWWPTMGSLLLDTLWDAAREEVFIPEEGPVRARLAGWLHWLIQQWTPGVRNIIKALVSEAQHDQRFATEYRETFIVKRRAPVIAMLAQAQEQGELASSINIHMLVDLLYGVLWYRLLTDIAPIDDRIIPEMLTIIFPE